LEEANQNEKMVPAIIKRAIKVLSGNGVKIDRETWIKEAEECEKMSSVVTAQTIINEVIEIGVEEQDKKRTWMEDAESLIAHGSINCARSVYAHALQKFPLKKSIWMKAASLEKNHGNKQSLEQVLTKAVEQCPQAEGKGKTRE
jgi:pre-mRNA-processing factor 6